jgi:hypothetical protein
VLDLDTVRLAALRRRAGDQVGIEPEVAQQPQEHPGHLDTAAAVARRDHRVERRVLVEVDQVDQPAARSRHGQRARTVERNGLHVPLVQCDEGCQIRGRPAGGGVVPQPPQVRVAVVHRLSLSGASFTLTAG